MTVHPDSASVAAEETDHEPIRLSRRTPASKAGHIDAAWWPHTRDLADELPQLLSAFGEGRSAISRISYNLKSWERAPRRLLVSGRVIRFGGFNYGDPHLLTLTRLSGRRVAVLVVPPDTEASIADRALSIAARQDNVRTADDILHAASSSLSVATSGA